MKPKQIASKVDELPESEQQPWADRSFNGRVLPRCDALFQDLRWQLPNYVLSVPDGARAIRWDIAISENKRLHELPTLLWASKCFIFSMLRPRGRPSHGASGSVVRFHGATCGSQVTGRVS